VVSQLCFIMKIADKLSYPLAPVFSVRIAADRQDGQRDIKSQKPFGLRELDVPLLKTRTALDLAER